MFFLVNGGYVYKTTCPSAVGSSTTHWTYAINDVLPYVGTTSRPCESHTATRLILSAVGVDRIKASSAYRPNPADNQAAAALGQVTSAINLEYARERRAAATFSDLAKSSPRVARSLVGPMINQVESRLRAIETQLSVTPRGSDPDLVAAHRLLGEWFRYQLQIDTALGASPTKAEEAALQQRIGADVSTVVNDLRAAAAAVMAKYPGVTNWRFLTPSSSG